MNIEGPAKLLSIYVGDSDHWHGKPLYVALVERARSENMAGATAFRGIIGFGAKSHIHALHLLDLSSDLPIVVQIVDSADKINQFLDIAREMVGDGLIVTSDIQVAKYSHE